MLLRHWDGGGQPVPVPGSVKEAVDIMKRKDMGVSMTSMHLRAGLFLVPGMLGSADMGLKGHRLLTLMMVSMPVRRKNQIGQRDQEHKKYQRGASHRRRSYPSIR